MGLNKSKRIIALIIWFIAMLALPVFTEVYSAALYYACVIFLMPITVYRIVLDEKFDKKFYKKWRQKREQGFWINVAGEGLKMVVIMILLVAASQFLVNGRTPVYIVSKLSGGMLTLLSLLLLGFGLLGGIAAWHENDKRYYRIHYSVRNNNIPR